MTDTDRLALPLLSGEQALKHVTHNEALTAIDALVQLALEASGNSAPPAEPVEGGVYAVGASASGDWAGRDGELAQFTNAGWRFHEPKDGWRAWDKELGDLVIFQSGSWQSLAEALGELQNLGQLGVNGSADATNRLTVRSNAVLLNNLEIAGGGTGDLRLNLNKEAVADTASVNFQNGFSGRAEIGLTGDNDFSFKVSSDGSAYSTPLKLGSNDNRITLGGLLGATPSYPDIVNGEFLAETSFVVPSPEVGTADAVDTIDGGFAGALLIVGGLDGQTITLSAGTGNLDLSADRVLTGQNQTVSLIHQGSAWVEISSSVSA